MNEGKEEEFFILVRKVGKLFYKKERMSNLWRPRPLSKNDRKEEEMGPSYHYKKMGHLIVDCPSVQVTTS